jgi:hypothetical protein
MIDLTNKVDELIKTDIDSIQAIVNKFATILQETKSEKDIPYLAYIIDISVNHINNHHKNIPKDWKAWSILIIKNKYFRGILKTDIDVIKIIDNFFIFWNSDYEIYCKNIISATEYDRDRGFVFKFENK